MKICRICNEEKDIFNFYIREVKNDIAIYRSECKNCFSIRVKNYATNNVNKLKVKRKKYYKNNKQKILLNNEIWAKNNRNIINKSSKKYYENNKKNILEKSREIYNENIEKEKNRSKEYRIKNKEKIKAKRNEVAKIKRKTNISFNLKNNISRAIRHALKKNNSSKNNLSFIKFINYSITDLKTHLENQFESWMTWDNYGYFRLNTWKDDDQSTWKWQIDHIIPQADLLYTNMEEDNFKKCWSLNNLRPYSAKQNYLDGVTRVRHKGKINAM